MALVNHLRKILGKSLYKSAYSRAFYTMYGVAIKEVRNSFRQFFAWRHPVTSLIRSLSICASAINRIILGRSLKYSFAFTGEDRILESIYKAKIDYRGYYVDVGCNHPVFLSNSYSFYRRGWRGICIDANPKLIKKFSYLRPRDIAVEAMVSDKTQEMDFYLIQNDVLSTSESENLALAKEENLEYQTIKVTPRTLTSILDEYQAPKDIDILSIDAEEHDYNVLNSLDFNRYIPKLIIVEDETFDISNPGTNRINNLLLGKGYILLGFILKNLYFRKMD